jgi:hypothetical protein
VDADAVESSGYTGCTNDCSGHEAGFEWARDREVTDESVCGGKPSSFIDGCRQFVEERQSLAEEEARETAKANAEDYAEDPADRYDDE